MSIPQILHARITTPPVRDNCAARCNGCRDEAVKGLGGSVWDLLHAYPADSLVVDLGSDNHQRLCFHESTSQPLFHPSQIGFINLDGAAEALTTGAYHGTTELVQHQPCSLVAAQTKYTLQPQCTGSVLLTGDPPHGPKPYRQRYMGPMEGCARRHRYLTPTRRAAIQRPQPCNRLPATPWAHKSIRPPKLEQVLPTPIFGAEAGIELHQILWVVLHGSKHYILRSGESSGYPAS